MRKPDRFEKLAKRVLGASPGSPVSEDAVNVLNAYHAVIVRTVKRIDHDMQGVNNAQAFLTGYTTACRHIREALARRKGGTR